MEGSASLILLTLGLCFVAYSVHAVDIYGKNTGEHLNKRLEQLRDQKKLLEVEISQTHPAVAAGRPYLQKDLLETTKAIQYLEEVGTVMYQDHMQAVELLKQYFEKEKEDLRQKLASAEDARIQAMNLIGKTKKEDQSEINRYQQTVTALDKEKNKIAKEYAEVVALQNQQEAIMNNELNKVIKEREELRQKLDQAQDLHLRALEAMAIAAQEGYKPINIPYQNEIEEFRNEISGYHDQSPSLAVTDLVNALKSTKAKLETLLTKLYSEGELPIDTGTAYEEIEDELAQREMEAVRVRDQQNSQRQNIIESIKNKAGFNAGYDMEEITSLLTANQMVEETNKGLQEIARWSAYLKAIVQVNDMLDECSNDIRDATEKNAAAQQNGEQESEETTGQQQTIKSQDESQENDGESLEIIYDTIHQKYLLYKDLHELYRTKLSTQIVAGLARANRRIPTPFPGCATTRLIDIQNQVGQWAEGVQYALRLTKSLHKGGNRSMIARLFLKFLKNIRNAFRSLLGREIEQETILEDDDSMTGSIEIFENQENVDFNKHFEYINTNLKVLDADEECNESKLSLFRFNFIFVKKAAEEIQDEAFRLFQELRNDPTETNRRDQTAAFGEVLKELETAEKRLRQLFGTLMTKVESTFTEKEREYQESFEEYKTCRYNTFRTVMPLFG